MPEGRTIDPIRRIQSEALELSVKFQGVAMNAFSHAAPLERWRCREGGASYKHPAPSGAVLDMRCGP